MANIIIVLSYQHLLVYFSQYLYRLYAIKNVDIKFRAQ